MADTPPGTAPDDATPGPSTSKLQQVTGHRRPMRPERSDAIGVALGRTRSPRPGGPIRSAAEAVTVSGDHMVDADEHAWQTRSRHSTSDGVVGYQRCPCGRWRVVVTPVRRPVDAETGCDDGRGGR